MVLGVVSAQAKDTYLFQEQETNKNVSHISGMEGSITHEMEAIKAYYPEFATAVEKIEKMPLPELEECPVSPKPDFILADEPAKKMALKQASNEDPNIPLDWYNNGYYKFTQYELNQPAYYVLWMRCGVRIKVVYGWEFICWDYVENLDYHCIGTGGFQYICWDGGEWEWANWNENDLTDD